jgi:hypothetical protein
MRKRIFRRRSISSRAGIHSANLFGNNHYRRPRERGDLKNNGRTHTSRGFGIRQNHGSDRDNAACSIIVKIGGIVREMEILPFSQNGTFSRIHTANVNHR